MTKGGIHTRTADAGLPGRPAGAGRWPDVAVAHDFTGRSHDLRNQADWLAGERGPGRAVDTVVTGWPQQGGGRHPAGGRLPVIAFVPEIHDQV